MEGSDGIHPHAQAARGLAQLAAAGGDVAALGAVAGIAALYWKRNPYAFPVSVFPLVFPCVYYLTHASLRYRNPIDPAVMLLGAAAVFGGRDVKRGRRGEPSR